MEPLVLFQPALHPFLLVRRVVVADQIDLLVGRNSLIDHAQKPQPLLMTVFLLAQAKDLAAGDIQRSEQGGCAVALVVMGHRLAAAFLESQAGLRAIQRLDLALSRPSTTPRRARAG
jgi:hypothetical protein